MKKIFFLHSVTSTRWSHTRSAKTSTATWRCSTYPWWSNCCRQPTGCTKHKTTNSSGLCGRRSTAARWRTTNHHDPRGHASPLRSNSTSDRSGRSGPTNCGQPKWANYSQSTASASDPKINGICFWFFHFWKNIIIIISMSDSNDESKIGIKQKIDFYQTEEFFHKN